MSIRPRHLAAVWAIALVQISALLLALQHVPGGEMRNGLVILALLIVAATVSTLCRERRRAAWDAAAQPVRA